MGKNCARQLLLAQVIRDSFGCKPVINKREHETVQINNVAQTDTDSALDDNLGESVNVDENRKKYRKKD